MAVAIAVPDARVACAALLAAYLINNVAQLSFASLVEKRGLAFGDERSLRLTPGLTEGTETIVAYVGVLPASRGGALGGVGVYRDGLVHRRTAAGDGATRSRARRCRHLGR